MALVNANYNFTSVDVGSNGRVSDSGIFRECSLQRSIEAKFLRVPSPKSFSGRFTRVHYYVIMGTKLSILRNTLWDEGQRIFNYRLSRTHRIVENAFGIICNWFRILRLHVPILLSPEKVKKIVLCCKLHNFLRPNLIAIICLWIEHAMK